MSVGWDVKWCSMSRTTTPLFHWNSKKSMLMRAARETTKFPNWSLLIAIIVAPVIWLKYCQYNIHQLIYCQSFGREPVTALNPTQNKRKLCNTRPPWKILNFDKFSTSSKKIFIILLNTIASIYWEFFFPGMLGVVINKDEINCCSRSLWPIFLFYTELYQIEIEILPIT